MAIRRSYARRPPTLPDQNADLRKHAWDQARTLSRIADRKYRGFAVALDLFSIALVSFAVTIEPFGPHLGLETTVFSAKEL